MSQCITKMDFEEVCNYYGSLQVFTQDGKHYGGIDDHDGTLGEVQIPDYLHEALARYYNESVHN